jgi:diguanylate cyclase (GGDEF)-like protein
MDGLSPTLLLCTAMLLLTAAAFSAHAALQPTYRGFGCWSAALWLNAACAAALTALPDERTALPWAQLLFMPWPMLGLLGLRRFHARLAWPGSAHVDLGLAGGLLAAAALLLGADASTGLAAWVPQAACSAALLYGAAMAASAARGHHDAALLRLLAAVWLAVAIVPALDSGVLGLQAGAVALGSMATAFLLLTMSSRRTEYELRQSRRRLRALANIDMLTQVPNRRRFEELARRALQADAAGSAALLLVDIDHFKQINDRLGHAAGDRALKLVSRCTLELLRAHDVAGRHGGDEFVMLLRRSSTRDAMLVAERLVSHLQSQSHAHALPRLSLSFGIVQMKAGESIDDTLQRADQALYEAKRLGRSRAVAADGDEEHPVFHSSQRLGLTSS